MSHSPHMPTPEEIKAATAAIRERWDEVEHYKRANMPMPTAEVPIVAISEPEA